MAFRQQRRHSANAWVVEWAHVEFGADFHVLEGCGCGFGYFKGHAVQLQYTGLITN
jgi:hypothetical protein